MNKSDLEKAAIRLASAEFYCKSLSKLSLDVTDKSEADLLGEKLEAALKQIDKLTDEVNRIRASVDELADKRYWWDVPFTTQEPSFDNTFSFDDGLYIESDKVCSVLEGIHCSIQPKEESVGYSELSAQLTNDNVILFYLNKKQLLNNINSRFVRKYIYNVMSVTRYHEVISYMNPRISPVSLALRELHEQQELLMQERKKRLDEAQREHDRRWDIYEMISHESLMTNKERWLYGAMSNEQYFNERIMRDYYAEDKAQKVRKEFDSSFSALRERSESMQKIAKRGYVKTQTDVVGTANIIRIMPVGEVVYHNGEVISLIGFKSPQQITEFDCDNNTTLAGLCGEFYSKKELFSKTPDPVPLARHIAMCYSDSLPKYNVLRSCPKGCSDELWRVWAEIRFLTNKDCN